MVVEDHVDPGPSGRSVAVVVCLYVQEDSEAVVLPAVDALAQLHLQLGLFGVRQVVGVEVNLIIADFCKESKKMKNNIP